MRLAELTPDIIAALRGRRIVECGAGDGYWTRTLRAEGIDCIGYDPEPGEGVLLGDHLTAAAHTDRDMLIVWPPDGTVAQQWIDACKSQQLLLCISRGRHPLQVRGQLLQEIPTTGRKGLCFLRIYRIEQLTTQPSGT